MTSSINPSTRVVVRSPYPLESLPCLWDFGPCWLKAYDVAQPAAQLSAGERELKLWWCILRL